MWLSSPVPPCYRRVWCVAGLPLATHLFLLSAEVGSSAVYVRPSGLQTAFLSVLSGDELSSASICSVAK